VSRPTWALIDEAAQAADVARGLALEVARRRRVEGSGGDARLAESAAARMRDGARLLGMVEREDAA
jgi:hypothetical protein